MVLVSYKLNSAIERGTKPDALGSKSCHWTRSCTSSLRVMSSPQMRYHPPLNHLCEGAMPWDRITFLTSSCCWDGCGSCSGRMRRGHTPALLRSRARPRRGRHHASARAPPHPLWVCPVHPSATPDRKRERPRRFCHLLPPPKAPLDPWPPPPQGHLAPLLARSRLALWRLGRVGPSHCHRSSARWLLASAVWQQRWGRFAGDPGHALAWQTGRGGPHRARERLLG